jgi:hypothetical protein
MTYRMTFGTLATGVLLATLLGCGGSAPAAASIAASTQPSTAAASAAAPSTESSAAAPSSAGSSIAIPSFVLPSGAKDLEALLPAQICGETAIKLSMSGEQFATTADPTFKAVLAALGKTASDVSFAVAGSATSGCTAGIFRIAGVDQNRLQETFVTQERASGQTVTQASLGGKSVYVSDQGAAKEYVYFKGDAVIFAQAKTEAAAASILQVLP